MVDFAEFSTDARPPTVVFVHAHPDDEAIFTGGTLALLARAGVRTVVLMATSGELGEADALGEAGDGASTAALAARRRDEARRSCDLLGVDRLVFLDHVDSGLDDRATHRPWGAFVDVDLATAAGQIADIAREERAVAIVAYDDHGVYDHPDHVHVHDAAMLAADLAGIDTRYLATVDREYLHFVASHLVDHAGAAAPSIRPIGSSTVEVTTTVAIHSVLDDKQQAIAAHASQVGGDPWLGVPDSFADVYGYEWYVRVGPAGVLDDLTSDPGEALRTGSPRPDAGPTPVTRGELFDLAAGLAAAVRHDTSATRFEGAVEPDGRRWWRLLATDSYDAWLIEWPTGGSVTPHDHGASAGAFAVVRGELTEVVFDGDRQRRSVVRPGRAHAVPAGRVHDVVNEVAEPALSVHVYSPPLSTMGYYDADGRLERVDEVEDEPAHWSSPHRAAHR